MYARMCPHARRLICNTCSSCKPGAFWLIIKQAWVAGRQSILGDNLDFKRSCWEGISPEARDFVAQLLAKDPDARPSAKQALQHPWLRGSARERSVGRPLSLAVVQRIQARRCIFSARGF